MKRIDGREMSPHSPMILEGDAHSAQNWQRLLEMSAPSFEELLGRNVVRRVVGAADLFRMDFVGLIAGANNAFFVFPKVFDPSRRAVGRNDLTKVLRCIQRFERRVAKRRAFDIAADVDFLFCDGGTLLNLFVSILGWTRDHGLHSEDNVSLISDPAQVDWGETFERGMALHFSTGIAFADVYGRQETREHGKLALAQAMALIELFDRLYVVSRLWISEHDPIIDRCREFLSERRAEAKDINSIRWAIQDADLHATRDHERALISSLRTWIEGRNAKGLSLRLYGVNAFHVMWEDMCNVALESTNLSHSDIASQPHFVQGTRKSGLGHQRPDLLVKTADGIVIADAKWYRVWRDEFPGTPDVIKQLMYELSVAPGISVLGNAFIVPIPEIESDALEAFGEINMDSRGLSDPRFPSISVVGVHWDTIVNSYISGVPLHAMTSFLTSHRANSKKPDPIASR